jgi:glucose dehydrogenase
MVVAARAGCGDRQAEVVFSNDASRQLGLRLESPPTLIDIKRNGKTIPAVAVYTKQGLLFVFDRVTGTPVFGVEERPVISDNPLPGDEYSPTQTVSAEASADCANDVFRR